MLKSNFFNKNLFKERIYIFYTLLVYIVVLVISFVLHYTHQLNSQSLGGPDKPKATRLRFCWVKKQIPWNKPIKGAMSASQKLLLLESDSIT